eukprot:18522-Pelagococcus_subviridis.AAC.15
MRVARRASRDGGGRVSRLPERDDLHDGRGTHLLYHDDLISLRQRPLLLREVEHDAEKRGHVAVRRRHDRHVRSVLGHETRGVPRAREDDDHRGANLGRRAHRARRQRLRLRQPSALVHDALRELLLVVVLVVEHLLGLAAYPSHGVHRLRRERASQGLRAQENRVCAVEHRVGDVRGLRARRPRRLRHRVHDPRDDDRLAPRHAAELRVVARGARHHPRFRVHLVDFEVHGRRLRAREEVLPDEDVVPGVHEIHELRGVHGEERRARRHRGVRRERHPVPLSHHHGRSRRVRVERRHVLGRELDPDLGPARVEHRRAQDLRPPLRLSEILQRLRVVRHRAPGEVEARDVHPRLEERDELFDGAALHADGADHLRERGDGPRVVARLDDAAEAGRLRRRRVQRADGLLNQVHVRVVALHVRLARAHHARGVLPAARAPGETDDER